MMQSEALGEVAVWLKEVRVEGVVQGMFVVGMGVYTLFALVVLKQTAVMGETINGMYNQMIKLFAWMHLFMAIALTAAAVVAL